MKNIKPVFGILSIVGSIFYTIVAIIYLRYYAFGEDRNLIFLGVFLTCASTVVYVLLTRLGLQSELQKIAMENGIIKKRIEQKELKNKLDEVK